jgi:hypothetical protein
VHGLPSSVATEPPGWHSPALQLSPVAQALASLQATPSLFAGFEQLPELASQLPATWHWSSAAHTTGLLPTHPPAWQVSLCVHEFPSEHAEPFAFSGFEQAPVAELQVPARWHWSSTAHTTGLAPTHEPTWQVSASVQALPSLHAEPSLLEGFEQTPLAGLQLPATWHWSKALQAVGLVPRHAPAWQASVWVQAFPSEQSEPLGRAGFEQAPLLGSQVPAAWHWPCAAHSTGFVPTQLPAWQVSLCVQPLLSLHAVPLAFAGFAHTPVAVLQVPALWHWSCAEHVTGFAPKQAPAWQVSLCVQALPSEQLTPLALLGFEHNPLAGAQSPTLWHW